MMSSCPTTGTRTSSSRSSLLSPVLLGDEEHNVCEEDSGDKTQKRTRSTSITSGGDHYNKKSTVAGGHDDTAAASSMVLIDYDDDEQRKQGKSSTSHCPKSRSRSFQEYDEPPAIQEVPFSLSAEVMTKENKENPPPFRSKVVHDVELGGGEPQTHDVEYDSWTRQMQDHPLLEEYPQHHEQPWTDEEVERFFFFTASGSCWNRQKQQKEGTNTTTTTTKYNTSCGQAPFVLTTSTTNNSTNMSNAATSDDDDEGSCHCRTKEDTSCSSHHQHWQGDDQKRSLSQVDHIYELFNQNADCSNRKSINGVFAADKNVTDTVKGATHNFEGSSTAHNATTLYPQSRVETDVVPYKIMVSDLEPAPKLDHVKGSTLCGQPVGFHDVKKDITSSARSVCVPPSPTAPRPSSIFDLPGLAPLHQNSRYDHLLKSEQHRYLPSMSLPVEDNTMFVSAQDDLPDGGADEQDHILVDDQQSQQEEFAFLLNHKEEEEENYPVQNNGKRIVANKNLAVFTDGNKANERHDHDIIQLQYYSNNMFPDDFLTGALKRSCWDRQMINHKSSSSSATSGDDTIITTSIDTGNIDTSAKRRLSSSFTQDVEQNRAIRRAINVIGGPYYSTPHHHGYAATSTNSAMVKTSTTTMEDHNKTFDQQPQGERLSNLPSCSTQSYKYGIPAYYQSTVASFVPITTKRQCNHYDDHHHQIEPWTYSFFSSRGREEQGTRDAMATPLRAKRLGKMPNQYKKLENQQYLLKNTEHDDDSSKYLEMQHSCPVLGKHQYTDEAKREYPISAVVPKNEQGYNDFEARNYIVATKNKKYGRMYAHKPDNFVAAGDAVPHEEHDMYRQSSNLFESGGCIFDAQSRYEDNIRAPAAAAQEVATVGRSLLRPHLSQQGFSAHLQERQQLLSVAKEKSYERSVSSSSTCNYYLDDNNDILNLGFQRGQRQLRIMAPDDNFDNQGCFEEKLKIHSFVQEQNSNISSTERHEISVKNVGYPNCSGHTPSIQLASFPPCIKKEGPRQDSHPRTSSLPPHYSERNILPLSTKKDKKWLSEFQCFIRSHCIEVFSASAHDVASRMNSKRVSLGQVGIRCRFCAHLPYNERSIRSSSFPSSITRLYQCATMMVRDHFANCKAIPPSVLNRYLQLKSQSNHSANDSKTYWMRSARDELGLTDTDEGIRFSSDTK